MGTYRNVGNPMIKQLSQLFGVAAFLMVDTPIYLSIPAHF
jgi:hypothetical protein